MCWRGICASSGHPPERAVIPAPGKPLCLPWAVTGDRPYHRGAITWGWH